MYRRVNSGRFIVVTTAGIVVVMAVFTWVMYGMARQVYTMTEVMVELNGSFKAMVVTQTSMAQDMHDLNVNMASMTGNIATMTETINQMSGSINQMTAAMAQVNANLGRITYDVSQASYAVSHPMNYMWGNMFPFQ